MLLDEYTESLSEYKEWIRKGFKLNDDESEELFYIISVRDDLDSLKKLIHKEHRDFSFDELIKSDKEWCSYLAAHRNYSFSFNIKRSDIPRSKWWWWIDEPEILDSVINED